jgi:hypothetical protein
MLERYPAGKNDPEYRVACYIVAHPEIFQKATKQMWENPFDDWMDEEDFSSGYRLLIQLGLHLYNGGRDPYPLLDGLATWDVRNYEVFKQACEIRRGRT